MASAHLAGEDADVVVERVEWTDVVGCCESSPATATAAAAGGRPSRRRRRPSSHCRQLTLLEHERQQRKHWMSAASMHRDRLTL